MKAIGLLHRVLPFRRFGWIFFFATLAPLVGGAVDEVELQVDQMVCPMCSQAVSAALSDLEGVASVRIDLDNKLVFVARHAGGEPAPTALRATIETIGFPVGEITVYPQTLAQNLEKMQKLLSTEALPARPTSLYIFETDAAETGADLWARVTLERKDFPLWQESLTESELPAAVFAEAEGLPGWPDEVGPYQVFDAPQLFTAPNTQVAVSPSTTVLLLRLHK